VEGLDFRVPDIVVQVLQAREDVGEARGPLCFGVRLRHSVVSILIQAYRHLLRRGRARGASAVVERVSSLRQPVEYATTMAAGLLRTSREAWMLETPSPALCPCTHLERLQVDYLIGDAARPSARNPHGL
jgi:hypothetical protein